jgi:hypothetical protein
LFEVVDNAKKNSKRIKKSISSRKWNSDWYGTGLENPVGRKLNPSQGGRRVNQCVADSKPQILP